jgi:hypothetical protein
VYLNEGTYHTRLPGSSRLGIKLGPFRNPVLQHRVRLFPLVPLVWNRTQNSRVAGARPNHQPIWDLYPTQGWTGTSEEPGSGCARLWAWKRSGLCRAVTRALRTQTLVPVCVSLLPHYLVPDWLRLILRIQLCGAQKLAFLGWHRLIDRPADMNMMVGRNVGVPQ